MPSPTCRGSDPQPRSKETLRPRLPAPDTPGELTEINEPDEADRSRVQVIETVVPAALDSIAAWSARLRVSGRPRQPRRLGRGGLPPTVVGDGHVAPRLQGAARTCQRGWSSHGRRRRPWPRHRQQQVLHPPGRQAGAGGPTVDWSRSSAQADQRARPGATDPPPARCPFLGVAAGGGIIDGAGHRGSSPASAAARVANIGSSCSIPVSVIARRGMLASAATTRIVVSAPAASAWASTDRPVESRNVTSSGRSPRAGPAGEGACDRVGQLPGGKQIDLTCLRHADEPETGLGARGRQPRLPPPTATSSPPRACPPTCQNPIQHARGVREEAMRVEGCESVTGCSIKLAYPSVEIRRVPGQTSSVDGEREVSSPSTE